MLKKTGHVAVKELIEDDWIKIAGQIYRITETKHFFEEYKILAVNDAIHSSIRLTVNEYVVFTIYNQK